MEIKIYCNKCGSILLKVTELKPEQQGILSNSISIEPCMRCMTDSMTNGQKVMANTLIKINELLYK